MLELTCRLTLPFKLKRIETGAELESCRLYAVCTDRGACEVMDFLAAPPAPADSILWCLKALAENGMDALPKSRYHYIDKNEKIYEFIGGRLRVAYFMDGDDLIICTNGFLKDTQRTKARDKNKAIQAKKDYFAAKKRNAIKFLK